MENTLVKTRAEEGRETDNPREDGHSIAFLLSDASKYPIAGDYEIPAKYNTDTIVILPVNEKKVYVYWELTEKLLMDKAHNPSESSFTVKIYELTLGGDEHYNEKEVYRTSVTGLLGQIYAECTDKFKPMAAAIGIEKDGVFNVLLKSDKINVPSYSVLGLKEEFWGRGYGSGADDAIETTKNVWLPHISPHISMNNIEMLLRLMGKKEYQSDDERAMLGLIKALFGPSGSHLLSLFLDFLRLLGLNADMDSIIKHLNELKGMAGSSGMSGSSEIPARQRS
ncbi:MAG: DUF4912 domain-containing protein [Nitrospirae bacterium]|nr:DUF4912 domain-containing protein [Nitrospirota bacterium]